MRKLVLQMQISLDGFVCGPNREIGWIFKSEEETLTAWEVAHLWQAGVHIMGRRTFQDMANYWPNSTEPFAAPMNEIPKIVFTEHGFTKSQKDEITTAFLEASRLRDEKGLEIVPAHAANTKSWEEALVITSNLADEIIRLKQQPGKEILAHGGASFAQALVKLKLIDEYRLVVHPVALGQGLSLFSAISQPTYLKLVNVTSFDTGAVVHVYHPMSEEGL